MTQDEIIRMARETGKTKWFGTHEDGTNDFLGVEFTPEQLERFAALVAEAKDKEIAELAEKYQRVACAYLELSEKVKETGIKTSKWGIE